MKRKKGGWKYEPAVQKKLNSNTEKQKLEFKKKNRKWSITDKLLWCGEREFQWRLHVLIDILWLGYISFYDEYLLKGFNV